MSARIIEILAFALPLSVIAIFAVMAGAKMVKFYHSNRRTK